MASEQLPIRSPTNVEVHLLRHVEAVKNLERIHGGGSQKLTMAGVRQARQAAEAWQAELTGETPIGVVISQPELRCEFTASLVARLSGSHVIRWEPFAGVHMGITGGLSDGEIRLRYPDIAAQQEAWNTGRTQVLPTVPGGEGLVAFARRIREGLDTLLVGRGNEDRFLLVCTTSTLNMLSHLLRFDGALHITAYAFEDFALGERRVWRIGTTSPYHVRRPP